MTRSAQYGRIGTIVIGFLAVFSYWLYEPLFNRELLIEWLRSSQLIVSIVLALVCLPTIYEILTLRMPMQALQLVFGILLLAIGSAGNAGWFLLWRMANYPEWMMKDAPINGFFVWVMILGAFTHLTAPRSEKGDFPRGDWVRISFVVVTSIALAIYVMISPPDGTIVADSLRPWLESKS